MNGFTTPKPYVWVTLLDDTIVGLRPYKTPPFRTLKLTACGVKKYYIRLIYIKYLFQVSIIIYNLILPIL